MLKMKWFNRHRWHLAVTTLSLVVICVAGWLSSGQHCYVDLSTGKLQSRTIVFGLDISWKNHTSTISRLATSCRGAGTQTSARWVYLHGTDRHSYLRSGAAFSEASTMAAYLAAARPSLSKSRFCQLVTIMLRVFEARAVGKIAHFRVSFEKEGNIVKVLTQQDRILASFNIPEDRLESLELNRAICTCW